MKKLLVFSLMAVLVLMSFSLTGCGGTQTESQSATSQAGSSQGGDLAGLLAKAKNVDGLTYDYTLTTKDGAISGKIWMQGKNFKSESEAMGQKVITLLKEDAVYMYNPGRNTVTKMSAGKENKTETPIDYSNDISAQPDKFKVLGSEVVGGMSCKVVSTQSPDGKESMKMWLSEEYGIPVKVEMVQGDGSQTLIEYKNIQVGALPADTFELPAGAHINDVSNMLKGIQGVDPSKMKDMAKTP
ncbi:MAG: LolA family protein [Bacillota bacterium]